MDNMNTATATATKTAMVQIIGTHKDTGTTVSIYRQQETAHESIRLMTESGYTVTVQAGYTV